MDMCGYVCICKYNICIYIPYVFTSLFSQLAKDWWSRQDYLVPDLLAAGIGVNIYDGINGFICNFIGQEMWTNQLSWTHQNDFLAAPREIWMVDDIIAGYRQSAFNLSMITVNNAGHMVWMCGVVWCDNMML